MPWKDETDPYKIWISEIILQQTRVEQGLNYYHKFMDAFPTVHHLAQADEQLVYKLWEGLGYYSRCANLIKTAKIISVDYKGVFPSKYEDILSLPGVGVYTAAAIVSFAYNLPYAVVDGNVYRVLSRLMNDDTPIDTTIGKKQFAQKAQLLLDKKLPGKFNQSIMDFGATVCKPKAPLCNQCALQLDCLAYKYSTVASLPVKHKKIVIKERYFTFYIYKYQNQIAIEKRDQKDIWKNLYQFPFAESDINEVIEPNEFQKNEFEVFDKLYQQKLTHQVINAFFVEVPIKAKGLLKQTSLIWIKKEEVSKFPFPRLILQFLEDLKIVNELV